METRPHSTATANVRYHASRVQTTPHLTAVFDLLFDVVPRRTQTAFSGLALVAGRLVFARVAGETTYRVFIGTRDALAVDILGFARHMRLDGDAYAYVLERLASIC